MAWAVFALLAVAILYFSLRPTVVQGGVTHIDKVEHLLAYLSLTAAGFAGLRRRSLPLVGSVLLFGVAIEGLQASMPHGRTGSVLDALANATGAGLAWAGWAWAERRRR